MNDDNWMKKNLNLGKAFSEGNFSEIIDYSDTNQKNLIECYINDDSASVEQSLRLGSALLHHFESGLQNEQQLYAIYRLGALLGTVEGFEALDHAKEQGKLEVFAELKKLILEFESEQVR